MISRVGGSSRAREVRGYSWDGACRGRDYIQCRALREARGCVGIVSPGDWLIRWSKGLREADVRSGDGRWEGLAFALRRTYSLSQMVLRGQLSSCRCSGLEVGMGEMYVLILFIIPCRLLSLPRYNLRKRACSSASHWTSP